MMSLQQDIMTALKEAMKSKNQIALTALRAVKSAILLAQTESGAKEDLTEDQELKILQKLVKQMKSKAKEFKAAEGDAKDKIKDELKKMTKEKKTLEKAL